MTKEEFIKEYPEIEDDGQISLQKMTLLLQYSTYDISKKDEKVIKLINDYKSLIKMQDRDIKINDLLE